MRDQISEAGFHKLESDFSDLDIYGYRETLLIEIKKFKDDRKAFRVAGNHIDSRLMSELNEIFQGHVKSSGITEIILTSGHKVAFSRGAKIELLKDATPAECDAYIVQAQKLIYSIQNCDKPVVAALNGLTLGGGLELALACDYRIAANRENVLLGLPEGHLGVLPAMGGTVNGVSVIGREKLLDLILNLRLDITAEVALEMGLVDKVTEPDNLITEACRLLSEKGSIKKAAFLDGEVQKSSEEYQKEIQEYLKKVELPAANKIKIAPYPAALLPFLLDKRDASNLIESLRYEREVFCFLQKTEDCREGITALIEERDPQFRGE